MSKLRGWQRDGEMQMKNTDFLVVLRLSKAEHCCHLLWAAKRSERKCSA